MTAKLPAPLVPAEVDLDGFDGMMIDIPRLRASKFDAIENDTAWRAGVNLWFAAWQSLPAGSLEDDDGILCRAAGFGRDRSTWDAVKRDALRSWVRCDDGRLYHPTVCETALTAWLERLAARRSSGGGNAARWGVEFDENDVLDQIHRALDALDNLSPSSETLRKYRKRYPRREKGSLPNRGVRPDCGRDRKLEAEAEREDIEVPPVTVQSPKPPITPAERQAAFERWAARLPGILAECPRIDPTATGIRQFAALIDLEAEGCDPDLDIVPAILDVAKTWQGRKNIFSWKLDAFAEVALGRKELRTERGKGNGERNSKSRTDGQGADGLAGVRLRRRSAREREKSESDGDAKSAVDGKSNGAS